MVCSAGSSAAGRELGLREQLQALQALFTSFMEVIISQMAGCASHNYTAHLQM